MIEISLPPKPIYDELYGIDAKYKNTVDSVKAKLDFDNKFLNAYDKYYSQDNYYHALKKYDAIEIVVEKLNKCKCYCKDHLCGWLLGVFSFALYSVAALVIIWIIIGLLALLGAKSNWLSNGFYIAVIPIACYLLYTLGLTLALLFSAITTPVLNLMVSDQNIKKKFLNSHGIEQEALLVVLRKREDGRFALKMKEYNEKIDGLEERFPGIKKASGDIAVYNRDVFNENVDSFIGSLVKIINECNLRYTNQWWTKMNPERFEREVANWFVRRGYEADTTQYIGDGGVDIVLKKYGQREFVQCKHYLDQNKVQVSTVRELFGVMASENVRKGYVVSLYGMTQGAYEFAIRNNIDNITLDELSANANGKKYSTETRQQFTETPFYSSGFVRVHVSNCYIHADVFDNIAFAKQELGKKNYTDCSDRWFFIISSGKINSKVYYTIASCPINMKQDIQSTGFAIV